jgi:hypothetical protein
MMRYLTATLLLLVITTTFVLAQDKPLPPPKDFKPETRRPADALPVLNLPEYVITGSDVASFTDDRKGVIADPDERSLLARAGRGEREQRFMTTHPTRLPLALIPPKGIQNVFGVKAGYGNFYTPSVQAWYANRFRNADVVLDGSWEKSRGHVRLADYEQGHFHAAAGTWLPKTALPFFASSRLEGDFRFEGRSYGLYADKLQQQLPVLDFQRNADHMHFRGNLISRKNPVFDHEISAFFESTTLREHMSVRDTLAIETWDQAELRAGIDATTRHTIQGIPVVTRGEFHFGDVKPKDKEASAPLYNRLGAEGRFTFTDNLWLDGGLDLYLFRGTEEALSMRVYPEARLSLRLHDDYVSWVAFEPEVREVNFDGLRRINPFLMLASDLRHTDVPLRFSTGVAFDNRRSTSGRLYAEYLSTSTWPRFDLLDDPVRQQWMPRYGSTSSMFGVHAELNHQFNKRTRIQVSAAVRTSHDDELDASIPYLPSIELRTLLSHVFPFGLNVEASAQLVGNQFTPDGDVPAWMLLAFGAEYRLFESVGIFVQASNLLDNDYQRWRGYKERPLFVIGGITIRI